MDYILFPTESLLYRKSELVWNFISYKKLQNAKGFIFRVKFHKKVKSRRKGNIFENLFSKLYIWYVSTAARFHGFSFVLIFAQNLTNGELRLINVVEGSKWRLVGSSNIRLQWWQWISNVVDEESECKNRLHACALHTDYNNILWYT